MFRRVYVFFTTFTVIVLAYIANQLLREHMLFKALTMVLFAGMVFAVALTVYEQVFAVQQP